jgi:hypothetical protein
MEQRMRAAAAAQSRTSIGGYGELTLSGDKAGKDGRREWVADMPRLVLFVAHQFNQKFRFYSELEVEHAIGNAEFEQAYVDWKVLDDNLGLRAGIVLVPMGILNQWHEPPTYHGVFRPRVETTIIPSTWREIGAGFFGQPRDWLRYELYAMTGPDPMDFGGAGIRGGRQGGSFAKANAVAITGRVEVEPLLGWVIGASGYASEAGPNAATYDASGARTDLSMPVLGWDLDARWRRNGIEAKLLYAEFRVPNAAKLMEARNEAGAAIGNPLSPIARTTRGAYAELAYDVLRPFDLGHQLLPFVRVEAYDTQVSVPAPYVANPTFNVREYTFGLSYRPIQQVVVKADLQLRDKQLGMDESLVNFGLGFMY